jgi:hypothetical protein
MAGFWNPTGPDGHRAEPTADRASSGPNTDATPAQVEIVGGNYRPSPHGDEFLAGLAGHEPERATTELSPPTIARRGARQFQGGVDPVGHERPHARGDESLVTGVSRGAGLGAGEHGWPLDDTVGVGEPPRGARTSATALVEASLEYAIAAADVDQVARVVVLRRYNPHPKLT